MSDTDPCIIGVQSCGCVTFALARPSDPLRRADEKAIAAVVNEGGKAVRTTVGEANAMPNFLAFECPHEPKGWEPSVPRPSVHGLYRDVCAVRLEGRTIGRVEKVSGGKWYYGRGQCAITHGPFRLQRDAVAELVEMVA